MIHPTLEKLLKEFDAEFGKPFVSNPDDQFIAPSEIRAAGCDDCYSDQAERAQHRTFLSAALTLAFEAGWNERVDKDISDELSESRLEARAELLKTLKEEAPSLNCNNDTINEFLALLDKHQEPTT